MTDKIKAKIDAVLKGAESNLSAHKDLSLRKLGALKSVSEKISYRFDELLYFMAVCYYRTGKTVKAVSFIEKCLEIQKNEGDIKKLAESYSFYGNILDSFGNYESSLEFLNKALRLQSRSNNKIQQVYTLLRIGNIYRKYFKEIERSLVFYKKALIISERHKNKSLIASSLGSIANTYLYLKDHANSKEYYDRSEKIFEEIGNEHYQCTALLGLGTINRELNNPAESIKCLSKGLAILQKSKNPGLETSISLNIAISYLSIDDRKNGKRYYDRSMSLIRKIGDKTLEAKLHQGFAEVFQKKKDYKNSLEHYIKFHELYSETFTEESQRVNKILRLNYEKEKSEREAEIYKLKTRDLQLEIDSKTKELNAMASYLSQKNEFVKNLVINVKEDLRNLRLEDSINSLIGLAVKKAESTGNVNEDLKRFENELHKFNFDFTEKLAGKFKSLTRVELKICSMIKINLSTKEMANLLFLSPRTVESHKYNINKKISLKKNQNINSFLNSI